jgi:hypothetical protein
MKKAVDAAYKRPDPEWPTGKVPVFDDLRFPGLLLDGRWLPVTREIGFVRGSLQDCIDYLVDGPPGKIITARSGFPYEATRVEGDLDGLLAQLLPLDLPTWQARSYLLLPTKNGEWTAVFYSEGRAGPEWPLIDSFRGFEVVGYTECPESEIGYGIRKLHWWTAFPRWMVPGEGRAEIDAHVEESGRWVFGQHGNGYLGEDGPCDPSARRGQDRFTHEHLVEAAAHYGLFPTQAEFFAPEGWGVVVRRTDPLMAGEMRISLAQARFAEPIKRTGRLGAVRHFKTLPRSFHEAL